MSRVSTRSFYGNALRPVAWICLVVWFALGQALAIASDGSSRPLKVGVSLRPVFVNMDSQGELSGLDIDLANAIFSEAGFDIEFRVYPWKRIVYLIEHGELDVALSAAKSPERREFALFGNEAYRLGHNLLFARKENAPHFDPEAGLSQFIAQPVRIGVQRGVSYSAEYDRLLSDPRFVKQLVVVDAASRLPELLMMDRADVVLGSEMDQQKEIKKHGLTGEVVPVFYLMSDEEAASHLMFSKKTVSAGWIERVDTAMRRLKASGRYQQILDSH